MHLMRLFDCPGAKSTCLHAAAEVRLTLEDGDLEVGAAFVRFPSLTDCTEAQASPLAYLPGEAGHNLPQTPRGELR